MTEMKRRGEDSPRGWWAELPPAFRSPLVWASAAIGTVFAVIVLLLISGLGDRVGSIEGVLPCLSVEIGKEATISDECIAITRKRVEALTPEQACLIIEKAEAQMVLHLEKQGAAPKVVIIDVRCPDETA